jgi:hypothetical protein
MELVKYVSYMDIDQRQEYFFVYGMNHNIRALVRMWKLSLVVEAVKNAHHVEEILDTKGDQSGGIRSIVPR